MGVVVPKPHLLETARAQMRPFQLSDAEASHAWFSDPEVMRFIPSGPDQNLGQTQTRIARYMDHQARHGFSKWLIIDKNTQQPIGDSGFYHLPDGDRVELGYRLARPYWGQNFATEVASKWLEVASHFLNRSTLYAFALPENTASLRVITKLGFQHPHTEVLYGVEVPLYSLQLPR